MKIGIVGYGSIGKRHAENAVALGHDVIVYDPIGRMDVKFEREIYEQADAVVIATPSPFHESGIRASVERGKHVLIEKPISIAIGHIPALLSSAKDKGLVMMMGNNLRFHPCVQQAKIWITQKEIGDPVWANFICAAETTKKTYRGDGVILNTGSHEVDLALYLLGPAKVVYASAKYVDDQDVLADFVLQHQSGARSSFHIDFETPNEVREFWIAGEKNIGVSLPGRGISLSGMPLKQAPGSYDDDYRNEMAAFIERIEGRFAPGASAEDGLATLKVLLDVRKKAGLE